MAEPRALVKNAADPKQVQYAQRKEKQRGERVNHALRAVMATPAGRVVMWELLTRAGIFRSVWEASAKIHYNAGRQDYGHELLATLIDVDEAAYQLMEREMRAIDRNDSRETAAVQTPAAGGETDG
jgi:L-amino acid N-acyltransferase YncA